MEDLKKQEPLSDEQHQQLQSMMRSCLEFFEGAHLRIEDISLAVCDMNDWNPLDVLCAPDSSLKELVEKADASTEGTKEQVLQSMMISIGVRAMIKSIATLCAGQIYEQIASRMQNSNVRYVQNINTAIPAVQAITQQCPASVVQGWIDQASGHWLNLENIKAALASDDQAKRDTAYDSVCKQIGSMVILSNRNLVVQE